jgi:hypothetical protein
LVGGCYVDLPTIPRWCEWRCRLCPATGASADPVTAWRWHCDKAHRQQVPSVTPARASMFDGVMGR